MRWAEINELFNTNCWKEGAIQLQWDVINDAANESSHQVASVIWLFSSFSLFVAFNIPCQSVNLPP